MMEAVIFDMDGVVSDTQQFHAQVESRLLSDLGVQMSPEQITTRYAGRATEVWFPEALAGYGIEVDAASVSALMATKWQLTWEMVRGRLQEISGASQLIRQLWSAGLRLAVASSSTRPFILEVLAELRLRPYFHTIVSSQQVERGKPAPDIFLLAAQQLAVPPAQTVVIEDGISGMVGARAAGMPSIGLVAKVDDCYPATLLVTTLEEITLPRLHALRTQATG
jgi:haloacid dehalogenase superfamily, subfamily IA, variant 3 with third motif having DD or ED/haloacid dehalogenase superfamily, subfamily IA, variant 1 with third motif having Dx(3-4)D or Dx(3-4)E